jgi:D-aminoacyl-tRNA deacylase
VTEKGTVKAVLQRVSRAQVTVHNKTVAQIGSGLVVLLGIGHKDGDAQARLLAEKIANLRIFEDQQGKMNLSLLDTGGEAIVVSQFTLYADTRRGRRPSFTGAALPEQAEPLINRFVELLRSLGAAVQTGVFGADMSVEIINDGPVTIWLDIEPEPG